MSLIRIRMICQLSGILSTLGLGSPALAQIIATPAAPTDGVVLPPVEVTGTRHGGDPGTANGPVPGYVATRSAAGSKTDTPLVETPQSISVLSNAQIRAQAVSSVSDALRYAPGVQADSNGFDARQDDFIIRGFDQSSSGLYQDGLRITTFQQAGVAVEPYGLERIDILRGVPSALYGQSAPGGLVNLISKRPQDQQLNEFVVQGGTYGRVQGQFDVGGAATPDGSVLYRITGLARSSDTSVDFARDDRLFLAPAITWRPDDQTSLTVLSEVQHDRLGSTYTVLPRLGTLDPNPFGTLSRNRSPNDSSDYFDRTRYSIGTLFEHRFDNGLTVRQNFRYLHVDATYQQTGFNGLEADNRTVDRSVSRGGEGVDNYVVDNQLEYTIRTGFVAQTFLVGVDGQLNRGRLTQLFSTAAPIDLYGPRTGLGPLSFSVNTAENESLDQIGVYFQDQVKFGEHLILTLGGRQDWARTAAYDRLTDVDAHDNDRAFTYRAGLTYLFDSGVAPYVSYATSFLPQAGATFSGTPFKPLSGEQYEGGIKYQPPGAESFLTAAVYQLTETNVLTTDLQNLGFSIQTGAIRARGVELSATVNLVPGLNVIGSYTHLNSTITKDNSGNAGKQQALVPQNLASTWVDYSFPDTLAPGLSLAAGMRYVGGDFGDNANTVRVPGYALFDASLRYRLGAVSPAMERWKLQVNATNIADKRYVSQCGFFGDGCRYGYGRTVLGSVGYSW